MREKIVLNPKYLFSDNTKEICLFNSHNASGFLFKGIEAELFRKIQTKISVDGILDFEDHSLEVEFLSVLKEKEILIEETTYSEEIENLNRITDKRVCVLSNNIEIAHEFKEQLELLGVGKIQIFNKYTNFHNCLMGIKGNGEPIFDIVIYIDEKFNIPEIRKINNITVENNISFLPLQIYDDFFEIGPLVLPNQTACYECYWTRLQIPFEIKKNVHFNNLSKKINRLDSPSGIINKNIALNFLNHECLAFLDNSFGVPKTIGNKLLFNMVNEKFLISSVLEVPDCIVCNTLKWEC
ncbi:hypothetical protein [Lysinibacillus xylanilyticus]|uniref:hypothetical protein n=1 Tax=Lysinibacillus xylanilyticus TaxID=582475 RepID=UPI003CFCD131